MIMNYFSSKKADRVWYRDVIWIKRSDRVSREILNEIFFIYLFLFYFFSSERRVVINVCSGPSKIWSFFGL